jgi:Tfp pilus assembly protein PilN
MIEINLVPDVKQELIQAQRVRSTVISFTIIIGFISIAVVTLLAIYVFGVQTVRSSLSDSAIKTGAAKLAKVTDLSKTLTIQNQLTKLDDMYDSKNVDSRVFDMLAALIPPSPNNVTISDLVVDSDAGTVTIQGQAANTYTAVEIFKKTISAANVNYVDDQNQKQTVPLATNVSTGDTSYGEDSTGAKVLRFSLSFTYATELFATASNNTTVTIGSQGNATDSFLGVPTSIFADRATDIGTGK